MPLHWGCDLPQAARMESAPDRATLDIRRRQVRHAAFLYFLVGITAPVALMYVPGKLLVTGDATATANNLRSMEGLFRLGIACELFHQVIGIFLVLALYRLFKPVNHDRAVKMVIFSLLPVPIVFANVLNELAAHLLATAPSYLSTIDVATRDALAYFFMRLHGRGILIASIFWGLWLFPFAMLVIHSGFFPRILGYLMIAAGIGYLLAAFAQLVAPPIAGVAGQIAMILEFGEIPIMVWLLVRAFRPWRERA